MSSQLSTNHEFKFSLEMVVPLMTYCFERYERRSVLALSTRQKRHLIHHTSVRPYVHTSLSASRHDRHTSRRERGTRDADTGFTHPLCFQTSASPEVLGPGAGFGRRFWGCKWIDPGGLYFNNP